MALQKWWPKKDMLKDFFVCFAVIFPNHDLNYTSVQMRGSVHTISSWGFLRFRSSKQNMKSTFSLLICPKPIRSKDQNAGLDL